MTVLVVAPPLVLWLAVAVRWGRGGRANRDLWWALVLCAVASTLNVPSLGASLDELLSLANVSQLLKHGCVVLAAWLSYEVVRGLTLERQQAEMRRRRRAVLVVGAVTSLVVLFELAPVEDETANFTRAYSDEPVVGAYWLVFLLALAVALIAIGRLAWWYRRHLPRNPLRAGMGLVVLGVAAGLVFVVGKAAYVAARSSGVPGAALATPEQRATPLLLAVSLVAIVAGVLWPSAAGLPLVRRAAAGYHLMRLRGLWREVTAAVPHVSLELALERSDDGPGFQHRLVGVHETELLLYRRVVETLDGLLVLHQQLDPSTLAAVVQEVDRTQVPVARRDATVARAAMSLAIDALAVGHSAASGPASALRQGGSLAEEVRWLEAVAAARPAAGHVVEQLRRRPSAVSQPVRR